MTGESSPVGAICARTSSPRRALRAQGVQRGLALAVLALGLVAGAARGERAGMPFDGGGRRAPAGGAQAAAPAPESPGARSPLPRPGGKPGTVDAAATTPAKPQPAAPPADVLATIQAAAVGDVISLGSWRPPSTEALLQNGSQSLIPAAPGTLIYSDDPETFKDFGILYASPVPAGPSRAYVYHVNGTSQAARVGLWVRNTSDSTATLTLGRIAFPAPSPDYARLGRELQQRWLESSTMAVPRGTLTVAPGAVVLLEPSLSASSLAINRLLAAIVDFTPDRAVEVATFCCPAGADPLTVAGQWASSRTTTTPDTRNRQGTFNHLEKTGSAPFSYDTAQGVRRLRIASGEAGIDPDLSGINHEISPSSVIALKGGYGVDYRLTLRLASTNGKELVLLANPRGGPFAGYVGLRGPQDAAQRFIRIPGGELPPGAEITNPLQQNTQAAVLARIRPGATPADHEFEFMPPAAAGLPVEFLFVPVDAPPPAPTAIGVH